MQTRLRRWWYDPRLLDAGAVLLGCLFLTVLAVRTPWSTMPRSVIAMVGLLGSLAQWYRRRQPEAATVAGAVTCAVAGNPGPLLVGLYSGASYGRRRVVWAVALVGWAGFAGWAWFEAGRLAASDVLFAAAGATAVTALGLYTGARRALTASLLERAERAESERRLRDERARTAERTRIAREMHDVLAHKVSLIALHAGALELAADAPKTRDTVGLIRVTAREALQDLRHVLGVLQTGPPDAEPIADVRALIDASIRAGQRVDLHDRAGPLPPVTARVVYRVVQEGLTNARKHAPGAAAAVTLETESDEAVTVTVRNEPAETPPMDLPGSRAGLVGLAERVRLVGGTIHSGPAADGGWELRATIGPRTTEGTQ